jgi:hypothetical protein
VISKQGMERSRGWAPPVRSPGDRGGGQDSKGSLEIWYLWEEEGGGRSGGNLHRDFPFFSCDVGGRTKVLTYRRRRNLILFLIVETITSNG